VINRDPAGADTRDGPVTGKDRQRSRQRLAAMIGRADAAGLREIGAKFQAFATELDRAVDQLERALDGGDPAAIRAAVPRARRAIDRMEEFLDLAGGTLVDLLSLELERQPAFSAVASYGEGLAAYKEAFGRALAGDPATARRRLARGDEHLRAFDEGLAGPVDHANPR
jgi:hypothetical protein